MNWLVHSKGRPGRALCAVADPATSPALPGEFLSSKGDEVDCPVCLEWMHA